jgi:hypothetical protein
MADRKSFKCLSCFQEQNLDFRTKNGDLICQFCEIVLHYCVNNVLIIGAGFYQCSKCNEKLQAKNVNNSCINCGSEKYDVLFNGFECKDCEQKYHICYLGYKKSELKSENCICFKSKN